MTWTDANSGRQRRNRPQLRQRHLEFEGLEPRQLLSRGFVASEPDVEHAVNELVCLDGTSHRVASSPRLLENVTAVDSVHDALGDGQALGQTLGEGESGFGGSSFAAVSQGELSTAKPIPAPMGSGSWNPVNRLDVNGDGRVTALDALRLICAINWIGVGPAQGSTDQLVGPFFDDVNGDGQRTPLDVLAVISYLDDPTVLAPNVFFAVPEDTKGIILDVLSGVVVPGNDGAIVSILAVGQPNRGGSVLLANREIYYASEPGFVGTEEFSYTVGTGIGGTGTITVDVTPVSQVSTTVVLTTSNASASYGQSVTFTATVTPSSGSGPTGTVQFQIDGSNAGLPVAVTDGAAAYSTATLVAGSHTVVAVYSGDGNFTGSTAASFTQSVGTVTPTITWSAPVAIAYGTALSSTQLNASAGVAGTYSYSVTSGTVLHAGVLTLSVTFTPTDTTDYSTATAGVNLTVNKAALTVTAPDWNRAYGAANPSLLSTITGFVNGDTSRVVSGQPGLSTGATSTSLTGVYPISITANTLAANDYTFSLVPGSLTVTKAATTVVVTTSNASPSFSQAVTFTATVTPSSGSDPTGTVQFQIDGSNAGPAVAVTNGAAAYSTATLAAGSHSVLAIYSGDGNFTGSTAASFTQSVDTVTPTITWSAPAAITYGTAASSTQLNASAGVAGTYSYNVTPGTVLHAGVRPLSVTFTPTDTVDYSTATAGVNLTVNKAALTVTAPDPSRIYGAANPSLLSTITGFVNGDTSSVVSGQPGLSTTATPTSLTGV
ncbi:MAG: Ig-like domain repeat protein, partial [Planctomycetota bacterium]|nr:Ig-like domain repeat protein [Planctomycetota bacterium]